MAPFALLALAGDQIAGMLSRCLHIAAAIVLVGGLFYARFVLQPTVEGAGEAWRLTARRFRPYLFAAPAVLLITGLYNLIAKTELPPGYHAWFGMKGLLAAHIFAVCLIAGARGGAIARRSLTALVISAGLLVALSAVLRMLSMP